RFGEGGIRGQWTRMITADRRASHNELGGGRRAGIVAFEFSKLPLARQEPKRIVNASLQPLLHFGTVVPQFHTDHPSPTLILRPTSFRQHGRVRSRPHRHLTSGDTLFRRGPKWRDH